MNFYWKYDYFDEIILYGYFKTLFWVYLIPNWSIG